MKIAPKPGSSAELLLHVVTVLVRDHLQVGGNLGDMMIEQLFAALRRRFGGLDLYVPVEDASAERSARILAMFNGRNHAEVCKAVGISRRTLYRALRKSATRPLNLAQTPRHDGRSTSGSSA